MEQKVNEKTLEQHVLVTENDNVRQICSPLDRFRIKGFFYMRRFTDGTFVDLSSQLKWSMHFLTNYLRGKYPASMVHDHMFVEDDVSLWKLNNDNIIWQEGIRYFGCGNGITICLKREYYDEIYCFYSDANNDMINRFYLNNIDLLKKFCEYFTKKAESIIVKGMKQKLHTPDLYLKKPSLKEPELLYDYSKIESFAEIVDIRDSNMVRLSNIKFTRREIDCIKWYAEGKSAKEVGKILQLSNRTVEKHLDNAKKKVNCNNLRELTFILLKCNKMNFL